MATELKDKSVHAAVTTERELARGRTAARISQVMDYVFCLIYGVIALQFVLRLLGARSGNGSCNLLPAFRGRCWRPSSAL